MAGDNKDEYVGVVYVLTNKSFPQYVKIGYTTNLENRLKELNRSECIPFPFKAYAYYDTKKRLSDFALQDLIDTINPNLRTIENFEGKKKKRKKEFYEMTPEKAYKILENIAELSDTADSLHLVTDDENLSEIVTTKKSGDKTKNNDKDKPSERFSFSKCQIPIGAELTFDDDSSIKAYVMDDHNVTYNGKTYTLTGLTKELRNNSQSVRGTSCWRYKGEILTDIRTRLEGQGLYK